MKYANIYSPHIGAVTRRPSPMSHISWISVSKTALQPVPVTICSGRIGTIGEKKWLKNVERLSRSSGVPPRPLAYERCSSFKAWEQFLLSMDNTSGLISQFSAVAILMIEMFFDPCRASGRLNCSWNQALFSIARRDNMIPVQLWTTMRLSVLWSLLISYSGIHGTEHPMKSRITSEIEYTHWLSPIHGFIRD